MSFTIRTNRSQRDELSKLDARAADAVAARAQGFPMAFGGRALYESAVSSMSTGGGSVDQVAAVYVDRDEYVALVGFGDGTVHVALGGPAGAFAPSQVWRNDSCESEKSCALGDVTGDGRADLVQFDPRTSDIVVSRATDDSFLGGALWGVTGNLPGAEIITGDLNGDGLKDRIAERVDGIHFLDRVEVALNDGYEFDVASPVYHELDCRSPAGCQYADLDEDGDDDSIESLTREETPGALGSDVFWIRNEFIETNNAVDDIVAYSCHSNSPPSPNAIPWEPASEIPFIDVRGTAYQTFAVAANLDVYRLDGGSNWVQTSASANPLVTTSTMAYARSNRGRIYRRDLDSYGTEIGRGSTRLFGGFSGIFNINPSNEVWEHWQGGWRRLSGGFANHQYAVGNYMQGWDDVNQEPLFVRRALGSWGRVERFNYGSWTRVGGPAEKIWVARGYLYSSSPASGSLFRLPLN